MDLPSLPPVAQWEPTRLYWQLMCQIVGKVRLKLHPPINHWWHVPLYVSPRGLTTGDIPYDGGAFDVELDLIRHRVLIRKSDGQFRDLEVRPRPIADFYRDMMEALRAMGIEVKILAKPYDCKSDIPFAEDRQHATYDADQVHEAWLALLFVDRALKEFRSAFVGKCSPVHMFWHSFDLACTRFSGRPGGDVSGADSVTQEAYSHEVNSAGFWFGDDNVPEAALYCYTAPLPQGITGRTLRPDTARWQELRGSPTATLSYAEVRKSADPQGAIHQFLQSSYEAGADLAHWPRAELER